MLDYQRIEKAIGFLRQNFKDQPTLEQVAAEVHLSPFHFQKMFVDWAGVSPKKFIQLLSLEYTKNLLKQNASLAETSFAVGLSGTSRLHDLFVGIECMTPGEFKNGGKGLTIHYHFEDSIFGQILIASTHSGICHISFENELSISPLKHQFPNAVFINKSDAFQQQALQFFRQDWTDLPQIKLHLKATPFQLKVWQSLLSIPLGGLSTYGQIAEQIENPKASRAVGTAIGQNPVAFIIPCHRVIKSSGLTGEYHWGENKKTAILGWEAAKIA